MMTKALVSFVPETKQRSLEELDKVFEIHTAEHIRHGARELLWGLKLRKDRPLLSCDKIRQQEGSDWIGSLPAFPVEDPRSMRMRSLAERAGQHGVSELRDFPS